MWPLAGARRSRPGGHDGSVRRRGVDGLPIQYDAGWMSLKN